MRAPMPENWWNAVNWCPQSMGKMMEKLDFTIVFLGFTHDAG